MTACFVLGDSIAVGVASQLPQCHAAAQVGITARHWIDRFQDARHGSLAIISLGANGSTSVADLEAVRTSVDCRTVWWLLPSRPAAVRELIQQVAQAHGDRTLDTAPYVGRDGLHPGVGGYQAIAGATGA